MKSVASVAVLVATVILASFPSLHLAVRASDLQPHAPIHILSNRDFTAANGVTSGSGTASDPYIIEGWNIVHMGDLTQWWPPILVAGTTSYFIIHNVIGERIELRNVANGRVENSTVWAGSIADNCSLSGHGTNIVLVANRVSNGEGGICVSGSNIFVSRNTVFDNGEARAGIQVWPGNDVTISDNIVGGSSRAILFGGGTNITLIRNVLNGMVSFVGETTNLTFRQNTLGGIAPLEFSLYGGDAHAFSLRTFDITPDNLVNGKPLYLFKDCDNLEINGVDAGQLIIVNCNSVHIENVELPNVTAGTSIFYVKNVTITRSRLEGARSIIVMHCDNVTLSDNKISSNRIILGCGSSDIFENDIVGYEAQIVVSGVARVYHNNFTNVYFWPTFQDASRFDNGYPSGGNFWSDFSGVDNCSGAYQDFCPDPDGIGDAPYTKLVGDRGHAGTDVYVHDHYPLMEPFALPVDGTVSFDRNLVLPRGTRAYFTAYIKLSIRLDPSSVILSSIRLNGSLALGPGAPVTIVDISRNSITLIRVRFNLEDMMSLFTSSGRYTLKVSGNIVDAANFRPFSATNSILVRFQGQ